VGPKLKEEKELVLYPDKNGTVGDLFEEIWKHVDRNTENGSGKLRMCEVMSSKISLGPKEETPIEELVPLPTTKTYRFVKSLWFADNRKMANSFMANGDKIFGTLSQMTSLKFVMTSSWLLLTGYERFQNLCYLLPCALLAGAAGEPFHKLCIEFRHYVVLNVFLQDRGGTKRRGKFSRG